MKFFTTIKLGPNREVTPAGFTLFRNVSIARIGEQVYGPGEVDIPPGPDGVVYIDRTPEEVFKPESMASGNCASFVIEHPIEDVGPTNWQHLSHGFFVDLRRGTGEQKDELVADLLVTTAYGLSQIDSGKRELSVGYDADYFQTGEGRGEQRNIIINHVASVDSGRCGGRCSIKDHHHTSQGDGNVKKTIKQRVLDAFKAKDEEGLKKALDEAGEETESGAQHIHIHTGAAAEGEKSEKVEDEDPIEKRFKGIEDGFKGISDRLDKMADKTRDGEGKEGKEGKTEDDDVEGELGEEAPEGTEDKARKSRDSAYLVESFENTKMLAEIIAPGVRIPTFDRAADPKKTFKDCVCGLRRKALQMGTNDAETAGLITQVRGRTTDSAEFTTMSCGQVRTLFNGVASLKKQANNASVFRDGAGSVRHTEDNHLTPIQKFKAASDKRWGIGK